MEPNRSEKMSPKPKSSPSGGPRPPARPAERAAARVGAMEAAPRLAGGVDLAAVELLALLGIADDLVGRRHLLEALLRRGAIGRIEVGMQLLGELAIGAADVVLARSARHAQNHVGIFGHRCAHPSPAIDDYTAKWRSWRLCASGQGGYPIRTSSSRSRSWARAAKRRRTRSPSSAAWAFGRDSTSLFLS